MWLIAQTPILTGGSANGSARRIGIGQRFDVAADEGAELVALGAAQETTAPEPAPAPVLAADPAPAPTPEPEPLADVLANAADPVPTAPAAEKK